MTDTAANADQIAYWNEAAGESWAALQARMDAQLAPLGAAARAALAPAAGERILDVGCGSGATTLELAEAVGAEGRVLGVDISAPMLAVARARAPAGGRVAFLEADAQRHAFEPGSFDALYSRFGVMFFADPAAAFANLRRALRPDGRLSFVCWRPMLDNPMFTAPLVAALKHVPPPPPPPEPDAPGPFAFADPERVRGILGSAGWRDVAIAPHEDRISPGDLDQALDVALRIGPLGGLLREHPQAREAAVEDIREALAARVEAGRVVFPSATWIVTARA